MSLTTSIYSTFWSSLTSFLPLNFNVCQNSLAPSSSHSFQICISKLELSRTPGKHVESIRKHFSSYSLPQAPLSLAFTWESFFIVPHPFCPCTQDPTEEIFHNTFGKGMKIHKENQIRIEKVWSRKTNIRSRKDWICVRTVIGQSRKEETQFPVPYKCAISEIFGS
jgi:hypothetical protein